MKIRRNKGFTLVEMLVVVAIFGFVIAGTSQMFVHLLGSYRQQSRISETNIEGLIGLEIMRQDLEKAGFGLPWTGTFNYQEATVNILGLNDATSNAPRGIIGYNNVAGQTGIPEGTDYLAVKATSAGLSEASAKWSFLLEDGSQPAWTTTANDNFNANDYVIVISPGGATGGRKTLISSGTLFSAVSSFKAPISAAETRVIYGVDSNSTLRMPFNRVDFFVKVPAASSIPKRCARKVGAPEDPEDKIGILYKAIVNQSNGGVTQMPLLDCVADMQTLFKLDTNGDGVIDETIDDITGMNAGAIRDQVKEVRVLILAHEGQRDPEYVHPVSTIPVKDNGLGRDYDLTPIKDWKNYRWKVYRISVKLKNLS